MLNKLLNAVIETNKTWPCFWFPMQDRRPGGDSLCNLSAPNGALHKYDAAFGGEARRYEREEWSKSYWESFDYSSWGHFHLASYVASTLEEPKTNVVYKGITFSKNDIQGLLVKVINSLLVLDGMWARSRFDDNAREASDFESLVDELLTKGDKNTPFLFDIDSSQIDWTYAYDRIVFSSSKLPPHNFHPNIVVHATDELNFHQVSLTSTGYPAASRTYVYWVQKDRSGKIRRKRLYRQVPTNLWLSTKTNRRFDEKGILEDRRK